MAKIKKQSITSVNKCQRGCFVSWKY